MFVVALFSPLQLLLYFLYFFKLLLVFRAFMPAPPVKAASVSAQHIDNRFQFVLGNNTKKKRRNQLSLVNWMQATISVYKKKQTNMQWIKKSGQMTLALTKLTRQDLKPEYSGFCFCLVIILTDECDFCVSITWRHAWLPFPYRFLPFFPRQMRGHTVYNSPAPAEK